METDHSKLSHDLRTPMSAILSSAELIEYYSDTLSQEKRVRLIAQIKTSIQDMLQILNASKPRQITENLS